MHDVAIIGGGIAGLALAIDLAKRGHNIVVVEKGGYPRHKVCGEYISMESHRYLYSLCPALVSYELPAISNFKLTSCGKASFNTKLDLGGFGISRYLLEDVMYQEASRQRVVFMLHTKAIEVEKSATGYIVKTSTGSINSKLACNASGRKSNLKTEEGKINLNEAKYVGVKYHINFDRGFGSKELIELHNFPGGYCGVSDIEDNKSCLCYIVNAERLKEAGSSVQDLEKRFLFQNKNLARIFKEAEFLFQHPLTVSGITFRSKKPVDDGVFYLGDAAGCIAPVTGNGMSIGLRSAYVLAMGMGLFLNGETSHFQLAAVYTQFWQQHFNNRITLSRYLQKLAESPFLTSAAIRSFQFLPAVGRAVIKQTHGSSF